MKNSNSFANIVATFFQRCWLIGTVVAIAALVWWADEPAWAGPTQQFTVPTATPQSIEPDDELIPTATPEPLFESDDNSDDSNNFDSNDDFSQPDEEPTPDSFFLDNAPESDIPEISEDTLLDDFNTDDSSNNFSDNIENSLNDSPDSTDDSSNNFSDNIDDSLNTPPSNIDDSSNNFSDNTDTQGENNSEVVNDNSFESTVPDITFNPIEDQTETDDFGDLGSPDDSFTAGGGASSSEIGGSVDTAIDTQSSDSSLGIDSSAGISANSGVVSISVLNIRRDPNPDSDIIDTLWRNDLVEISQTTSDGTWLLVCCGVELGSAGWVSSLYINYDSSSLNVGSLDSGTAAAPVAEEFTPESTTTAATASTTASTTASAAAANLELTMTVTDTTVQAGQILDIEYTVENIGNIDAQNIRLSNELPAGLYLNNFKMDTTGQFTHTLNTQNNRRILNMNWPQVDAAQTVTATVIIQIAPGAPNGLVIDNLAGVNANNSAGDTAAISVGTPPLAPPSFRRR